MKSGQQPDGGGRELYTLTGGDYLQGCAGVQSPARSHSSCPCRITAG
jgi:hypothetical protein